MTRRFTSEIVNEIGPGEGHPGAGRRHDAGRDGVDLRHVLDEPGPLGARRRHRQAARDRRLARARGGDRPRLPLLPPGRAEADGPAARGADGRGAGLRQRRLRLRAASSPSSARRVVAISDSSGGRLQPDRARRRGGARAQARRRHARRARRAASRITNDELVLLDCDVLAPCALEQVITEENADRVRARIVVEGANGPTTPAADEILEGNGVVVLPDVLANAGGVVVSYFEWVQGLQEYFWKEDEVNERLNEIVSRAFAETWALHESRGLSMRMAAYGLGVAARRRGRDDPRPLPVTRGRRSTSRRAARSAARCDGGSRACGRSSRSSSRRSTSPACPELEARVPRVAAGGRDRRRARVRLPRRRGRAAGAARRFAP